MNQSALAAAVLFGMFLVFVAVNDRLSVYTDVLWGGGGKGGGTLAPKKEPSALDKGGDGFDEGDALELVKLVAPYPFNIPLELMDA